jgi:hypothetical protein
MNKPTPPSRLKHGHYLNRKPSPTFASWQGMIARCTNPKHGAWERYGGRGITVCARWRTFSNFLEDMGIRPEDRTLDRIDNDRGYEPANCRWATRSEQQLNRRKKYAPPVEAGQVWERTCDGSRFRVLYTIGDEAKIKYLVSGRGPYAKLKKFGHEYAFIG